MQMLISVLSFSQLCCCNAENLAMRGSGSAVFCLRMGSTPPPGMRRMSCLVVSFVCASNKYLRNLRFE